MGKHPGLRRWRGVTWCRMGASAPLVPRSEHGAALEGREAEGRCPERRQERVLAVRQAGSVNYSGLY